MTFLLSACVAKRAVAAWSIIVVLKECERDRHYSRWNPLQVGLDGKAQTL